MIKVTVLGSGTAWPRLDRNAAGYLIELNDFHLLLDIGPGTLKQLLKIEKSLNDIDAIFVSHFHPDHVLDLILYLFVTRYEMGFTRKKVVKIFACEGFKRFLSLLYQAFDYTIVPKESVVEIIEIPKVKNYIFSINNFDIITTPVKHREESLAIRIEKDGKSLVYSGDTGYCEEIIELAKNADLLIIECSDPERNEESFHLSPEEIGIIAKEAEVKALLVSHFYPHSEKVNVLEKIKTYFKGECILAKDFSFVKI